MTTPQDIVNTIGAFAGAAAGFLPPRAQLAINLALAALQTVRDASTAGVDVTDEQLQALFDQFEVNKADALLAQQEAAAEIAAKKKIEVGTQQVSGPGTQAGPAGTWSDPKSNTSPDTTG